MVASTGFGGGGNGTLTTNVAQILIVDDHPVVRDGLTLLISQEHDMEVCGQVEGLTEALQFYTRKQPDLLIIDISLKDGSGIELIKEIKARNPNAKMLVASMHDEALFAERALRAGAMGYINKSEGTDRVVDAIRQVLGGKITLSPRMTERMLHRSVGTSNGPERSPIEKLSDRELETFEMIGQGLTTRQIAARLHLSPKTVESYREHIKVKLNLENANELTRHAVQWVLENS